MHETAYHSEEPALCIWPLRLEICNLKQLGDVSSFHWCFWYCQNPYYFRHRFHIIGELPFDLKSFPNCTCWFHAFCRTSISNIKLDTIDLETTNQVRIETQIKSSIDTQEKVFPREEKAKRWSVHMESLEWVKSNSACLIASKRVTPRPLGPATRISVRDSGPVSIQKRMSSGMKRLGGRLYDGGWGGAVATCGDGAEIDASDAIPSIRVCSELGRGEKGEHLPYFKIIINKRWRRERR